MIQIEHIPDLQWAEHSAEEYLGENIVRMENISALMWEIKLKEAPLAVCGLVYGALTNPPWLWFLITREFEKHVLDNVRYLRELACNIPSGTLTSVEQGFEPGYKFARFFGFFPTVHLAEHNGKIYKVFRRG